MSKTVQDFLSEVSYESLKTYKPTQFAVEYINFIFNVVVMEIS